MSSVIFCIVYNWHCKTWMPFLQQMNENFMHRATTLLIDFKTNECYNCSGLRHITFWLQYHCIRWIFIWQRTYHCSVLCHTASSATVLILFFLKYTGFGWAQEGLISSKETIPILDLCATFGMNYYSCIYLVCMYELLCTAWWCSEFTAYFNLLWIWVCRI